MPTNRVGLFAAVCVGTAFLNACSDVAHSPPARPEPSSPDAPAGSMLAPLDLVYVCGNKFLATNGTPRSVTVEYRILGTDEVGSLTLREGLGEDPGFSETELETTHRGVVELYQDGERVARRDNEAIPCGAAPAFASVSIAGPPEETGAWSAPLSWPGVAIHLSLLPDGKVLSWGRGTPQIWNPATGSFTPVSTSTKVFCSGHSFLADGKLLVSGGHISDDHGLPDNNLFTAASQTWTPSTPMRRGRWYPTNTTLSTGEVLIVAGRDEARVAVAEPEVWKAGTIRVLSTAKFVLPYYPRMFQAPNGKVFLAGEWRGTRYLDPAGTGRWSTVGDRLYGTRDYGGAVMYDVGKILYAGGGRTTNTAEIIDLNSAAPAWQWTGSMAFARRHLNATVLPTGEVLVTGGVGGTAFSDMSKPVHAAEVWSPTTGTWKTLASNAISRGYHATSILLPDGRVLNGGSGEGAGVPNEMNVELFSPPYLFKGARPTITSAPSLVGYGSTFSVATPQASAITKVSLVRLGSTTHAFDMNQRFEWLSFTRSTGSLSVSAPTTANRTPPGHYLLFILNADGVPSVAKIVKVGSVSDPDPPPPPPPPPGSSITLGVTGYSDAVKQYVTLKWTGASGTTVAVYRNGSVIKSASNTGRYTNSITFVGSATYRYKVCESGSTRCSSEAAIQFSGRTAPPMPLAVAAWTEPTRQLMDLRWAEVTGTTVDVHRNGRFLKNTPNTGRYTNSNGSLVAATYAYKVCEAGTTRCSGVATVQFTAGNQGAALATAPR